MSPPQNSVQRSDNLFSRFAGNTGYDDSTESYYGLFGNISSGPGSLTTGRVIEVDKNGVLLFDARLSTSDLGQLFFRGEKIDLNNVIDDLN